ncbi:glycosyltransferase [Acetomicrobium sp. S15 = DSM 107314]|uniref:glycosyltransferase n=1 Tax=Acetomicrobium sp. S15 = DSM 107314 TaxID=2529858 RepID=UPI0018E1A7D1|nr:glycosyltransferase [Acetomicrobium sp. S15 = DSM 107314]
MKVLHVAASLSHNWGGPARSVRGLTKGLMQKGVEVAVFALDNPQKSEREVGFESVEARLFKQDWLSKIWTAHSSALDRALQGEVQRYDLLHIHEIWHHPHFAAYRAAKKFNKPYVVSVRGALDPWCLNYKGFKKRVYAAFIQQRMLNRAAAIHALVQNEVKDIRAFGVHSPVVVIPNGIDPEEFRELPEKEEIEKLYPELKGKNVVLFLGRIHPKKGLDILAKAFGVIAKERDDIRLIVAGPDNEGYQKQVEQILEVQEVRHKCIFTGMLTGEQKLAALSRADIFVLPSYSEGFSMAILEVLACGLPVVITHQCNFPEVAEANAGIVIDPDVDQLTAALYKLIENPELRGEMGSNGRRLVMEHFTWDRIAEQMMELYQSVLEGKLR